MPRRYYAPPPPQESKATKLALILVDVFLAAAIIFIIGYIFLPQNQYVSEVTSFLFGIQDWIVEAVTGTLPAHAITTSITSTSTSSTTTTHTTTTKRTTSLTTTSSSSSTSSTSSTSSSTTTTTIPRSSVPVCQVGGIMTVNQSISCSAVSLQLYNITPNASVLDAIVNISLYGTNQFTEVYLARNATPYWFNFTNGGNAEVYVYGVQYSNYSVDRYANISITYR